MVHLKKSNKDSSKFGFLENCFLFMGRKNIIKGECIDYLGHQVPRWGKANENNLLKIDVKRLGRGET